MFKFIKNYFKDCDTLEDVFVKLKLTAPYPKMYLRLRNLFRYSYLKSIETDKITMIPDECIDKGMISGMYFEFKSQLGPVRVLLYQDWLSAYCLEYTTYAGFDFKITAHSSRIDVQPKLGQNLNAIDIDLAILELENYFAEVFGDSQTIFNEYKAEKQLIEQEHENEVQKLC